MEYKYKAFYNGQLIEGVAEGESKWDVVSQLKNQGIMVLHIDELAPRDASIDYKFLEKFTRQLYQLLKSGLTTDRAILFLCKSEKKYGRELNEILNSLRAGDAFSTALKKVGIFPRSYTEMVKSGEESGNLEDILELLLYAIQERNELRKHIINALIYPSFLFIVSILSFMLISLYVIPKFKVVLQSADIKLPFLTKIAFAISDIFSYIVISSLIFFLLILISVRILIKKYRQPLEIFLLKMPFVGNVILKLELIKFSQSMYFLLKSNLPLNIAIDIATGTVNMLAVRNKLVEVKAEVLKGSSLNQAIIKQELFPDIFTEIISIGEQTGELHRAFHTLYTQFSNDFKDMTKKFISLLEPAIIIVMGLLIGFLVFSMMLAVFSISSGI